MARLEDLTTGARVSGVVAGQAVTVIATQWHGNAALTLTYRDDGGHTGQQLLLHEARRLAEHQDRRERTDPGAPGRRSPVDAVASSSTSVAA